MAYADITGANFAGADLTAVVFDEADGSDADLRDVILIDASLAGGRFPRANLSGATLIFVVAERNRSDRRRPHRRGSELRIRGRRRPVQR